MVPAEMLTKYHVKPGDIVLAGAANGGHDDQLQVYDVRSPPAALWCCSCRLTNGSAARRT